VAKSGATFQHQQRDMGDFNETCASSGLVGIGEVIIGLYCIVWSHNFIHRTPHSQGFVPTFSKLPMEVIKTVALSLSEHFAI
jgi:hypothetical protein